MTVRTVVAALLLAAVSAAGIAGFAYPGAALDGAEDVRPGNVPYDGRFTFVRISYEMYWGLQTGAFLGDVKWAHDYPHAEQNFGRIIEEISDLDIVLAPNGGNVLPLDDPMLTRYPVAYMAEPGFWRPSEADLEALGSYLRKGGFIIFDDFTGDHWYNLVRQLDLAVPGLVPIELTAEHPIFHSFFDIDTLEMAPMYGPPPTFWGIFENNDPNGRMMGIINYENDIGEYWEYSNTGWFAVDVTNEAYRFGVNYVMYALTH
ncbi:MAG: DUF4159 domain-containing protein [Acidobacteria bacterium]|nr:DUF4159 domain-containing protein [Acidobacteriota bacterium]